MRSSMQSRARAHRPRLLNNPIVNVRERLTSRPGHALAIPNENERTNIHALDNLCHPSYLVGLGLQPPCRRQPDPPTACGCGDCADHQPDFGPARGLAARHASNESGNNEDLTITKGRSSIRVGLFMYGLIETQWLCWRICSARTSLAVNRLKKGAPAAAASTAARPFASSRSTRQTTAPTIIPASVAA